mmetsp:Transcript_105916/g.299872  ORF Transcript_105916/g.299872 Transcript_105916/m.299872 type:complete len:348 (-) Transcript_105916:1729-2772(-)
MAAGIDHLQRRGLPVRSGLPGVQLVHLDPGVIALQHRLRVQAHLRGSHVHDTALHRRQALGKSVHLPSLQRLQLGLDLLQEACHVANRNLPAVVAAGVHGDESQVLRDGEDDLPLLLRESGLEGHLRTVRQRHQVSAHALPEVVEAEHLQGTLRRAHPKIQRVRDCLDDVALARGERLGVQPTASQLDGGELRPDPLGEPFGVGDHRALLLTLASVVGGEAELLGDAVNDAALDVGELGRKLEEALLFQCAQPLARLLGERAVVVHGDRPAVDLLAHGEAERLARRPDRAHLLVRERSVLLALVVLQQGELIVEALPDRRQGLLSLMRDAGLRLSLGAVVLSSIFRH